MSRVTIHPKPRVYSFEVNGYGFVCQMDWRSDEGLRPIDILIRDLEECVAQLKSMPEFKVVPPFSLPPLAPEDTTK